MSWEKGVRCTHHWPGLNSCPWVSTREYLTLRRRNSHFSFSRIVQERLNDVSNASGRCSGPGYFWEGSPALGPVQWPGREGVLGKRRVLGFASFSLGKLAAKGSSGRAGPVRWGQRPHPKARYFFLSSQPLVGRWVGWGWLAWPG